MSRPLNVALVTVGSRGDVQPMLALALALRRRGHTVRLGAPPDFRDWIAGHGFECSAVGREIKPFLTGPAFQGSSSARTRAFWRFLREQIPMQVHDVRSLCEGADVMAWAGVAFGAVSVAEKAGLPLLGVTYTTCMLPSDRHPSPDVSRRDLPAWVNRLTWRLGPPFAALVLDPAINRARAGLGLPPMRFFDHFQGPWSIAADPVLLPPDPQWPPRIQPASFIYFDDDSQALDPDLDAWLDDGEPPVFVGFGSMPTPHIERIERVLREAIGALGRRCLVAAGWAGLGGRDLPPGWCVAHGDLPHHRLFPRVAAVVHHGGSGTTAAALRAGVPQLILPLILDQHHHAHHLHLAGLGPKPVPMGRIDARQLADGLRYVLNQPPDLRAQTAARLKQSDGCGNVARRLESLAGP